MLGTLRPTCLCNIRMEILRGQLPAPGSQSTRERPGWKDRFASRPCEGGHGEPRAEITDGDQEPRGRSLWNLDLLGTSFHILGPCRTELSLNPLGWQVSQDVPFMTVKPLALPWKSQVAEESAVGAWRVTYCSQLGLPRSREGDR